jgi:hypothetical protein
MIATPTGINSGSRLRNTTRPETLGNNMIVCYISNVSTVGTDTLLKYFGFKGWIRHAISFRSCRVSTIV